MMTVWVVYDVYDGYDLMIKLMISIHRSREGAIGRALRAIDESWAQYQIILNIDSHNTISWGDGRQCFSVCKYELLP